MTIPAEDGKLSPPSARSKNCTALARGPPVGLDEGTPPLSKRIGGNFRATRFKHDGAVSPPIVLLLASGLFSGNLFAVMYKSPKLGAGPTPFMLGNCRSA